ncbi:Prenyltransferase and squalene oxidase repeat protein [Caulifigura coniformis]|uniref:Prenyltransferase and squalene oxidase repeat protein n=1 Tax=Caulifigura coniformis TaxID=2527983 RepID=A0A517SBL8_9PLAN|nr:prenyltransferase/squalene oxidase repeat-containing protein [Caulifigura coniformis]QDT53515.1 Prenyltransferase and squalene oxidase repeat protein [Caulifigura coniformis]
MRFALLFAALALLAPATSQAADKPDIKAARDKGIAFLKTTQRDDGGWSSTQMTGVTGLVAHALLSSGVPADDPAVAKALALLAKAVQPDGSIGAPNSRISAYETSIAVLALSAANKDGKYDAAIQNAIKFLRTVQFNEARGTAETDANFGGAGYNAGKSRPDLSNTHFFLEAFEVAGISSSDPAVQASIKFLSRCQNLAGPDNPDPEAAKVNDGGFQYTPVNSETDADSGLRSYGSMTYAGFKSMLYAGLSKDDPRVKAALSWIRKHYTLKENPGMGANGIYYYYYLFARALNAANLETLEDDKGTSHDWKQELASHLISEQAPNGSWTNRQSDRWQEGDPNLVTAYALFALSQCEK